MPVALWLVRPWDKGTRQGLSIRWHSLVRSWRRRNADGLPSSGRRMPLSGHWVASGLDLWVTHNGFLWPQSASVYQGKCDQECETVAVVIGVGRIWPGHYIYQGQWKCCGWLFVINVKLLPCILCYECDSFRGVPNWRGSYWLGRVWTVTRQPCRRQPWVRAESCWLCCAVVCGTAMYLYIIIVAINMYIVYDVSMYLYAVHCLYMNVISCGAWRWHCIMLTTACDLSV